MLSQATQDGTQEGHVRGGLLWLVASRHTPDYGFGALVRAILSLIDEQKMIYEQKPKRTKSFETRKPKLSLKVQEPNSK